MILGYLNNRMRQPGYQGEISNTWILRGDFPSKGGLSFHGGLFTGENFWPHGGGLPLGGGRELLPGGKNLYGSDLRTGLLCAGYRIRKEQST